MRPPRGTKRSSVDLATQADPNTLIRTDSPDDFEYEGANHAVNTTIPLESRGDDAYVEVDNPDDFE